MESDQQPFFSEQEYGTSGCNGSGIVVGYIVVIQDSHQEPRIWPSWQLLASYAVYAVRASGHPRSETSIGE